jgi:hypothetical protein
VPRGRLKLREEPNAVAHLIAYERPDLAAQKESRYRLIEVREPTELIEALASVLGIKVVVNKSRRLFLFEGMRIHLDSVEGLGDFIEFEGVAASDADPGGSRSCWTTSDSPSAFAMRTCWARATRTWSGLQLAPEPVKRPHPRQRPEAKKKPTPIRVFTFERSYGGSHWSPPSGRSWSRRA